MTTDPQHQKNLAFVARLVTQFHRDFCVVRKGVPEKPKSERDICLEQIYSIARGYGFSAATVDDLMDQAEREIAEYTEA